MYLTRSGDVYGDAGGGLILSSGTYCVDHVWVVLCVCVLCVFVCVHTGDSGDMRYGAELPTTTTTQHRCCSLLWGGGGVNR